MLKPENNPNRARVLRMGMSMPIEILLIWLPLTLLLTLFWTKTVGATEPQQQDVNILSGEKVTKTDKEWREELSSEVYNVCRSKGTERAFSGKYWNTKTPGVYVCAACGNELFSSETKYDSGSGWPSYWEPLSAERIKFEEDNSMFAKRVEIQCSRCDSHLGHIFDDGPQPTGKRYCVNSASLKLVPREAAEKEE